MKVLAVSDNTQLAKLEDVAFLLGVWLQVSDSSGIKALQDMSKAYFSWNELKAVFFEVLEEQKITAITQSVFINLKYPKKSYAVLMSHYSTGKLSSLHFVDHFPSVLISISSILFARFPLTSSLTTLFSSPYTIIDISSSCSITEVYLRVCTRQVTQEADVNLIQLSMDWCLESFETCKDDLTPTFCSCREIREDTL